MDTISVKKVADEGQEVRAFSKNFRSQPTTQEMRDALTECCSHYPKAVRAERVMERSFKCAALWIWHWKGTLYDAENKVVRA